MLLKCPAACDNPGMVRPDPAEQERLLAAVRGTHERITAAKGAHREAVVAALAAGVSGTEIARVLGVTRHRVYQLRDGK